MVYYPAFFRILIKNGKRIFPEILVSGHRKMALKKYVEMVAHFDTDGKLTPMCLIWSDGRKYEIDRVLDIRRAASLKAGGYGIRYTVKIQRKKRYIFFDDTRWFVEEE